MSNEQNYSPVNFQGAGGGPGSAGGSSSSFVSLVVRYSSTSGGDGGINFGGIFGCAGCSLYLSSGSSISGSSIAGAVGSAGDVCPPPGATLIPNSAVGFGFTLFSFDEATIIYACENGVLVAQCIFLPDGSLALTPSEVRSLLLF